MHQSGLDTSKKSPKRLKFEAEIQILEGGFQMNRYAVLAASASLLVASACMAADNGFMGQPLPSSQPTQQAISEIADWSNVALDGLQTRVILNTLNKLPSRHVAVKTRGAKDVAIYKKASSGVVLVATSEGLGSGAYLGTDLILTNLHVVRGSTQVGVVFKPSEEGGKIDPSSMVRADVIRIDPLRDLALLKVALAPQNAHPLDLGTEAEIQVGADVHAIGHPDGEAWTYTRGTPSHSTSVHLRSEKRCSAPITLMSRDR
jgi:S1-C subfamily serine protease